MGSVCRLSKRPKHKLLRISKNLAAQTAKRGKKSLFAKHKSAWLIGIHPLQSPQVPGYLERFLEEVDEVLPRVLKKVRPQDQGRDKPSLRRKFFPKASYLGLRHQVEACLDYRRHLRQE